MSLLKKKKNFFVNGRLFNFIIIILSLIHHNITTTTIYYLFIYLCLCFFFFLNDYKSFIRRLNYRICGTTISSKRIRFLLHELQRNANIHSILRETHFPLLHFRTNDAKLCIRWKTSYELIGFTILDAVHYSSVTVPTTSIYSSLPWIPITNNQRYLLFFFLKILAYLLSRLVTPT